MSYTFLPSSSLLIALFAALNAFYPAYTQRQKEARRYELTAPFIYNSDPDSESGAMKDGGDKAWVELGDRHPDFKYAI